MPHRLRRIIICVVLIPTVILFDILYQVVFRDFFLNRRSEKVVDDGAAEAQTDDTENEEFNIGYWFLIYCIFLALHLINTIFIY